jgi:DNA-binding NtrC family response regulator
VKGSRILILSEEGIVRDLLSQLFVSKGGKVRTAATDMEGLKLLKKNKFDLVIADPGTLSSDPAEVISRMKRMGRQLPVALVNASSDRKFGADLVVGRPLDVDRILPLVSQVLASRGTVP